MVRTQENPLTIAGFAREGGVGVETVRYYQRRGLLDVPAHTPAAGTRGAIRRYSAADVRRLHFIRGAQEAGFTLAEISELIALDASDDRPRVRELACNRIAFLDAKITALQAARDSLRHLERECAASRRGPCPILDAFDRR